MNQDLDSFLAERIKLKKTLTLVTGVFDLLHEEHHNFLTKAKESGDLLLVGIESDERVRQMKGKDRPINNQNHRLENLLKWDIADCIFILPEKFSKPDDHRQLIDKIRPDFMAVSSHSSFVSEKKLILKEFGAKLIVVHDFNPEFSSSKIIENLKKKGCS
jgi:D-beta-D-heptose 7-phosphate kinase/D-beta-D-heptose 1-phosphate adenosyltransferase